MDARPARLRGGEILAGVAATALLVLLLAVHWYGHQTGWQVLSSARWAVLVTVAAAFGLVLTQITRRAPALPVTLTVIVTVLGLLTVVWLVYRVAISAPANERVGAWLGLLSACLIVVGALRSMRQEGIRPEDGPQEIPLVTLPSLQEHPQARH
jgi:hypothetical protein